MNNWFVGCVSLLFKHNPVLNGHGPFACLRYNPDCVGHLPKPCLPRGKGQWWILTIWSICHLNKRWQLIEIKCCVLYAWFYVENLVHFQVLQYTEMVRAASELRKKMETLKTKRREEIECSRIKRIYSPDENGTMIHSKGKFNLKHFHFHINSRSQKNKSDLHLKTSFAGLSLNLKDLEEFVDYMKGMGNH